MDRDIVGTSSAVAIDQLFLLTNTVEALEARPWAWSHPATQRNPIVEATLHHGHAFWTCPRVYKLGTSSAQVELGQCRPPEGIVLELVLKCRYEGRDVEYRIDATVTRTGPTSADLVFGEYDNRIYTDLVKLAYAL